MKNVRIRLSEEARQAYDNLESSHSKVATSILNAVKRKSEIIKHNFQYGNPLSKKLIHESYVKKYGITNLHRVELPNFWRMLYTVLDDEEKPKIVAVVLDIIDHKTYDKKFGYKKK